MANCNKCGEPIQFNDGFKNADGTKHIPLDEIEGVGLVPHTCINVADINRRLTLIENLLGNSEVPMARVFELEKKVAHLEQSNKGLEMQLRIIEKNRRAA